MKHFKIFIPVFFCLFSFTVFAQNSLLDYGFPNVSGKSIIEAPMASVVFLDQAPNAVNGLFSDETCSNCGTGQQTIADNFAATISNTTTGITEIVIWGGYYPEDIPNTTDDFTIIIHSDAGGAPGTVLWSQSGLQATSRTNTGVVLFGVHEYMFTFDLSADPIMLASSGTYWLELFNNSVESGNFFWETGDLDASHGIVGSNFATEAPGVTWLGDTGYEQSVQINGDDAIIPVELISFEATVNGNNVNLNWVTATETNNKGFQVERKSTNTNYRKVGFINGNGTTTQLHTYGYIDKNLTNDTYTYRIKQIDLNGKFSYSKEVTANVNVPASYSLNQNYPNPFNPTTKIDFSLAVDSKVTIQVFDLLGREVATILNSNLAAGEHTVNFNAANLQSGIYFYRLQANGINGKDFNSIKKMILTK